MDLVAELQRWSPLGAAVGAAALGWFKVWNDAGKLRQEREHAEDEHRIDLIKIAEEISAKQLARLYARVEALEAELTELRKEHAQSIAAKDAKIALLEGQLRQAWALADSYEQKLTAAGIDHERPRQAFWGLDAGNAPTDLIEGRLP